MRDDQPSDSDEEDSDGIAAGDIAGDFLTVLPLLARNDPSLKKGVAFFRMPLLD